MRSYPFHKLCNPALNFVRLIYNDRHSYIKLEGCILMSSTFSRQDQHTFFYAIEPLSAMRATLFCSSEACAAIHLLCLTRFLGSNQDVIIPRLIWQVVLGVRKEEYLLIIVIPFPIFPIMLSMWFCHDCCLSVGTCRRCIIGSLTSVHGWQNNTFSIWHILNYYLWNVIFCCPSTVPIHKFAYRQEWLQCLEVFLTHFTEDASVGNLNELGSIHCISQN